MSLHVAIWMDHEQARIFHVERESFDEQTVRAHRSHASSSSKKGSGAHARGNLHEVKAFYDAIAMALSDAQEIVVLGPGTAKLELTKYFHKSAPRLGAKIVGVETADHPTDGQLVAHVRKYFRAKDRMLGNAP